MNHQPDLFQKPRTQRTARKVKPPAPAPRATRTPPAPRATRTPPATVRTVDPSVVAAVARFSWWPIGPGCGGEAGREMDNLAKHILRADPNFTPPTDPLRWSCDEAIVAIVDVMRLIGTGSPGVSYGKDIDKAFNKAVKYLAKQSQPTKKAPRRAHTA